MDQDHSHHMHHVAEHDTVTPSAVSLFDNHTSMPFADSSLLSDVSGSSMDHDHHSHHSRNHQIAETDQAISNIDTDQHSAHAHGQHGGGGASSMDHSMMMAMWFHFGYVETILFSFWKIDSIAGLIGSMIGIFLMSMLYEGLKVFREYLLQRSLQFQGVALGGARGIAGSSTASSNNGLRVPLAGEGDSIIQENALAVKTFFRPNPCSFSHFVQTFLHMVQMVVSYFLMLIFMTYNVWLCFAVVLGAGCGYYVFGWRKRTIIDINEHCH